MKQRFVYFATVLCSILFLFFGNRAASSGMPEFQGIYQDHCVMARVEGILSRQSAAKRMLVPRP